jgi:acyl dehydratase
MVQTIPFEDLAARVGAELGVGGWVEIDQARIDAFAAATDDLQWIHVDPERAAAGPYGGTIAHGYLTLSMLPRLTGETYAFAGVSARLNYGLDRVRFPAPVRSGARIRDRATLLAVEPNARGARVTVRNEIEIEGGDRPACIAETITLLVRAEGTS